MCQTQLLMNPVSIIDSLILRWFPLFLELWKKLSTTWGLQFHFLSSGCRQESCEDFFPNFGDDYSGCVFLAIKISLNWYPLVNIQKTMENHHLSWFVPWKMVMFHSYVSLSEGNPKYTRHFPWNPALWKLHELPDPLLWQFLRHLGAIANSGDVKNPKKPLCWSCKLRGFTNHYDLHS